MQEAIMSDVLKTLTALLEQRKQNADPESSYVASLHLYGADWQHRTTRGRRFVCAVPVRLSGFLVHRS